MTRDTMAAARRTVPARLLLLACALFATGSAAAQTPNVFPLPRPDIDPVLGGEVEALLRLPDGSILVGGGFTRLGTRAAPGCGRLQPDGTPDTTFNCATSNARQYVLDPLGRVYALRNGSPQIVRLLADGSIDGGFPGVTTDASIGTMVITAEGIHLAGPFTTVNGTPRSRLARVGFDGALDPTWVPTVDGPVFELAAPGDAFIYVGGSFANVGGAARTGLARLTRAGATVDAWNPVLAGGDGATVSWIIGDGSHVFVSGAFGTVQGLQRRRLARIGTDTAATLDPNWAPQVLSAPFNGFAPTLLAVLDGSLYVGSTQSFTLSDTITTRSNRLFRLTTGGSGTIDPAFQPLPSPAPPSSNGPRALVRGEGGGRLVVGGRLDGFSGGAVRLGIAPLNADGSVDAGSALVEALVAARVAVTVDADGAATLTGNFARIGTAARPGLARLNTGGTLDGAFRPAQASYTAARRIGNAVWVADDSTDRIRKLDPASGDAIAGFTPIAYSNLIARIDVLGNHVYLTGTFTLPPSPTVLRVGRVDATTGVVDSSFGISINSGSINAVAFDAASNSLFLAGSYTQINGAAAPSFARWDLAANALFPGFAPVLSAPATDLAVDGEGGIYVAGGFTTVNGQNCRAPARLAIDTGALDPTFNCARPASLAGLRIAYAGSAAYMAAGSVIRRYRRATGAEDPDWLVTGVSPSAVGLTPRGADLWVAGEYTTISGVPRNALAGLPLVERFFGNGFE
jgi:hypothetical protein